MWARAMYALWTPWSKCGIKNILKKKVWLVPSHGDWTWFVIICMFAQPPKGGRLHNRLLNETRFKICTVMFSFVTFSSRNIFYSGELQKTIKYLILVTLILYRCSSECDDFLQCFWNDHRLNHKNEAKKCRAEYWTWK